MDFKNKKEIVIKQNNKNLEEEFGFIKYLK